MRKTGQEWEEMEDTSTQKTKQTIGKPKATANPYKSIIQKEDGIKEQKENHEAN